MGPCKGCTDREIACHGTCERYLNWHAEYLKEQKYYKQKAKYTVGKSSFLGSCPPPGWKAKKRNNTCT